MQGAVLIAALGINIAGGTLDLSGVSNTVSSVTLASGSVVDGTLLSSDSLLVQTGTISAGLAGLADIIKNSSGTATLSGTNRYTGGTIVEDGTLLINNANALPNGGALMVGASASSIFGASQVAPSLSAAGLAPRAPETAVTFETSTPIFAASASANAPLPASVLSTLSHSFSATSGSPSDARLHVTTVTTIGVPEQQVVAVVTPLTRYEGTDAPPTAACTPVANDAPAVATAAAMSNVARDAVFNSYRSSLDRTVARPDNAQSAGSWAVPSEIESPWNSTISEHCASCADYPLRPVSTSMVSAKVRQSASDSCRGCTSRSIERPSAIWP